MNISLFVIYARPKGSFGWRWRGLKPATRANWYEFYRMVRIGRLVYEYGVFHHAEFHTVIPR